MSADGGPRRVGHSIVKPGSGLGDIAERLDGARWDMVELDVLSDRGELIVAHDASDLEHPERIGFADALAALRDALPAQVTIDVDIKGVGYELQVLEALRSLELVERTLVSTMEAPSLRVLRSAAPELRLGLSVPRARRNYLAHPLTRPAAHAMLAYLRLALPRQAAMALRSGLADAIMAHWGVVTSRLVAAVGATGGELYVWTVDDPRRLRTLASLGVTGVITNERDLFTRAGLP
jgi:glycerophosphoryl diester phosphodiesterase